MSRIELNIGDKVRPATLIDYEGFIIPVADYIVAAATTNKSGRPSDIGIVSDKYREGWGDLNGVCDEGHGLWVSVSFLVRYFRVNSSPDRALIKDEFVFRRKNLKGKIGNIISQLPGSQMLFVEFDEDLGGCSADGLGKAGHCVMIPQRYIKNVK